MNPTERILQYFGYAQLPAHVQDISRACYDLAHEMAERLPVDAETTTGLRKLLEAKDCFVRAVLQKGKG